MIGEFSGNVAFVLCIFISAPIGGVIAWFFMRQLDLEWNLVGMSCSFVLIALIYFFTKGYDNWLGMMITATVMLIASGVYAWISYLRQN